MKSPALFCLAFSCSVSCAPAEQPVDIRFATFNIAMGLESGGGLRQRLEEGDDPRLAQVAEILQRVRPDVVLLNEFDYQPGNAALLRRNYLSRPWSGQQPLNYPYHYEAPVNTGVDSGLDINGNGQNGDPEDAWGFGRFPGQYGMAVLSHFPLATDAARSFRNFRWRDMPGALRPVLDDGIPFHRDAVWQELRLSSKSHWDLPIDVHGKTVHLLASHPTPTVFDGPEDRNGRRNHDENRIWADYVTPGEVSYLVDDAGVAGHLIDNAAFVIAGDLNADPLDGGWQVDSMAQLLDHPLIDASCIPRSTGAIEASKLQAGINRRHRGDPASDTADFNDEYAGNLRIDYVLPSSGWVVVDCGVFWPSGGEPGAELVSASDHRLVWIDLQAEQN